VSGRPVTPRAATTAASSRIDNASETRGIDTVAGELDTSNHSALTESKGLAVYRAQGRHQPPGYKVEACDALLSLVDGFARHRVAVGQADGHRVAAARR
jgi:hypothetical protein